jgi:hypothetical protein
MYEWLQRWDEPISQEMLPFVLGVLIVLLVVCVALFIFLIVAYILESLGLYTIAKRRGMLHPWLAWIPYGNVWLIGSLSDQYQNVAKGRVRNRAPLLLVLNLVYTGLYIVMQVATRFAPYGVSETDASAGIFLLGSAGLALLVLIPISVLTNVFVFMAMYDVYASCDPKNKVLYLVLSLIPLVNQIARPLFLFLCRNKDDGMPSQERPAPENPVEF